MKPDLIASLLGPWSVQLNFGSVLLRLVLAGLIGAVVGCERSSKRHSAGLRTFMVSSLACCTAMLTDCFLIEQYALRLPAISAAAVLAGALISGNSILFSSKSQIKGLTTSAGLWACGLLGMAAGAGLYTLALLAFAALLCSLSLFPAIEKFLKNRSNHFEIHLELRNKENLQDFVSTIRRLGLIIDDIESNPAYVNSGLSVYTVSISISSQELKKYKTHKEIIEALSTLDYVYYIGEI